MNFPQRQVIFACIVLSGFLSAPAFAQGHGIVARGDCPKIARMARPPAAPPVQAMSYKPVAELEQYIASLQAEISKSERSQKRRGRSSSR